jgi:hypothetical protein
VLQSACLLDIEIIIRKVYMRRLKSKAVLVTAAVTAMAILIPASAPAADFTKNGSPIVATETVQLEGYIGRVLEWGYSPVYTGETGCLFNAELTLKPNGQGQVSNFKTDLETCMSHGEIYSCEVQGENVSLPWPLSIGGTAPEQSIVASNTFLEWKLSSGNCASYLNRFYYEGAMELIPDNPAEISSVSFAGKTPPQVSGDKELIISAEVIPAGVYGIE